MWWFPNSVPSRSSQGCTLPLFFHCSGFLTSKSSSSFLTCCNFLFLPTFASRLSSMFLCISRFSSTCRLSSAERCHRQTSELMEISGWPPLSVCPSSSSSSQQTRTSWGQNLKDLGRWLSTPLSTLYYITTCTAPTPERGLDVCPRGKKRCINTLKIWACHIVWSIAI